MTSRFDVKTWTNLNVDDQYSAGHAFQRASMLMNEDPFCALMGRAFIDATLVCFFSETGLGNDKMTGITDENIWDKCVTIWRMMPTEGMFSSDFKERVICHINQAIFPEEV